MSGNEVNSVLLIYRTSFTQHDDAIARKRLLNDCQSGKEYPTNSHHKGPVGANL